MRLSRLISQIQGARLQGTGDPEVTAVVCDSRQATTGTVFAALPGAKANGASFVSDAVTRGASAVIAARPVPGLDVPQVVVPDPRQAVGEAAAALTQRPAEQLNLIGVTGTNGKTTVAWLLAYLLRTAGEAAGLLGTIQYETGVRTIAAPLTTPDAVQFTGYLVEMVQSHMDWAVAEVSSHALDQYRVWPHRFACAVFTNLSRDHLDYHADMEQYLQSKKRLFGGLDEEAWAVVNQDDPAGSRLIQDARARVCRYGLSAGATVHGRVVETGLAGSTVEIATADWTCEVHTPLVGSYNVQNCLAALSALHCLGFDLERLARLLRDFPGVPGRLERITGPDDVTAFVDYAHTDDALRSVLTVLRPLAPKRLLVVFGCGGDRDTGKRPMMARVSEDHADVVVVTSDNPRTEDPEAIIADIMKGFSSPDSIRVLPDRREAIHAIIQEAQPGDVVLVAGKGHEDYQIIGAEKHHLDDREVVREAMESRHP